MGWDRWVDFHDQRYAVDASDRRNIANEIEVELIVKRRIDRIGDTAQEKRVAVCRRTHDRLGPDIAASTWPVVDDEGLAAPLREVLAHKTRYYVIRSTRRKPDHDAHGPRRIGLRPSETRHGR